MSFTVYRSSAGSGKTFTLVREYMRIILLEPGDFRHILAITFTNKAAAEMKERVLHSLNQLSAYPDSSDPKINRDLLPQLISRTGLSGPEIAERARLALKLILHHYSDFAIGTIDSFSHRIIRSFAHDFGLPVQFNVELDADELLKKAVDLLLDQVGTDDTLTRFLVKFLEVRMDEDKGWNIDRILVDFAHVLMEEEGQEHILALRSLTLDDFTHISEFIYERIRGFEKLVRKIGTDAVRTIEDAGLTSDSFYQGNRGICKYFMYLAAGRFDKLQPSSLVMKTITEEKWVGGKASPEEKTRIFGIVPQLLRLYEEVMQVLNRSQENYFLNKLLVRTLFPLAVLNEIDRVLTEFKKQNNLVHISEFNRRISSIVMREPVPFIYERLGERYKHLMIDEFQDTSRMQWQNFVPLIENSLASGYFNLVAGDGKQAIYRWRNGDVTQFALLPELHESKMNPLIMQRQRVLETHFREESLNRNYRSKREIVEFNNRFFRFLEGLLDEPGKRVYLDQEQVVDSGNGGGCLTIEFLKNGQDEDTSFDELNYTRIKRIIVEAREAGYSMKEIAILCRKNDNASRIARMLMEEGIEVVSSESLLLAQSREVNFLISVIRFLYEKDNQVNQAEMAVFLLQTGRLPGMTLPEALQKITYQSHNGREIINLMNRHGWKFIREELLALPLFDLAETLIRMFSLNRKPDPYLQFFLDAILKFMAGDTHGSSDFLAWWEEQKTKLSLVVPEGIDAIRIMTIHKSKGLQFPVVIFPFAIETRRLTRDHMWVDLKEQQIPGMKSALLNTEKAMENTVFRDLYKEEEQKSMLDLINLLYVVMTRAEERVYVLTSAPPKNTEELKSLPGFFAGFLESEGVWDPGRSAYRFGSETLHHQKPFANAEDPLVLQSLISNDWRNKLSIRGRAPEMWDLEDPTGNIHFGTRVHTLLAGIKRQADIPVVLAGALTSGLISTEDMGPINGILAEIFNHPDLGPLYSDQVTVKNEPDILLPDGHVFRPDRVVFDQGFTSVIEYKTGKRNQKHLDQLNHYETVLNEMGYRNVRKFLVYLHENLEVLKG
ncbi:MAG: UvrD-helicase domain-containing protein [Bacteroidota bacterium]